MFPYPSEREYPAGGEENVILTARACVHREREGVCLRREAVGKGRKKKVGRETESGYDLPVVRRFFFSGKRGLEKFLYI